MIETRVREQAIHLTSGTKFRAALATESESYWYKFYLRAGEAVEIELSEMPRGVLYDLEVYDGDGSLVLGSAPLNDSVRFASYEGSIDADIFIRVYSQQGSDPNHEFALHVDRYKSLNGILTDNHTLYAFEGPYRIGGGDLVIAPGAVLDVEAGTILNVRSANVIRVHSGGTLNLLGSAELPVVILGATEAGPGGLWKELELAGDAVVKRQFVTIYYDHQETSDAPPPGQVINILPSERPALIRQWYQLASPYLSSIIDGVESTGKWYDPWAIKKRDLYFGMDVEMFAQWEYESGRLCDTRFQQGVTNYWEYVNAGFLHDILLARQCVDNGESAPHFRIQRLMDYLCHGKSWREKHGVLKSTHILPKLDDALEEESELHTHVKEMSTLFWWSHNTSIVYWDQLARELGLHNQEEHDENLFVNGVIIRLHFSSDLPYQFLSFGNQMPPVGMIGIFLNHGPFKYPDVYPCPPAPAAPEGSLDYHDETTIGLIKTYFEFLLQDGTNPVFTWWLPTPADREARRILETTGLSMGASMQDWKRELVDPAIQTLHEIQVKYLKNE
ncbi:hypothetical protein JJB07_14255 [Tumebacillus sp. ITR2]|uniref:FHA domain-containing protein n=1 Tax=Tumebacillus amylolyticus TaxID=2801339 RepID=A0ABS1JC64_9BACL|nr:hypothetical protein [Tumebacillus amylolyticus]MBL0387800.1 hypothetical protein [Tumebacillus amylolyticus]